MKVLLKQNNDSQAFLTFGIIKQKSVLSTERI